MGVRRSVSILESVYFFLTDYISLVDVIVRLLTNAICLLM
jgi:hypothetical protein